MKRHLLEASSNTEFTQNVNGIAHMSPRAKFEHHTKIYVKNIINTSTEPKISLLINNDPYLNTHKDVCSRDWR